MADMQTFSYILDGFFLFLYIFKMWGVDDLFTHVQNTPKKIIQISTTGRG